MNGEVATSPGISAPPLSLTFVANAGEEALWQPPVTELRDVVAASRHASFTGTGDFAEETEDAGALAPPHQV